MHNLLYEVWRGKARRGLNVQVVQQEYDGSGDAGRADAGARDVVEGLPFARCTR